MTRRQALINAKKKKTESIKKRRKNYFKFKTKIA